MSVGDGFDLILAPGASLAFDVRVGQQLRIEQVEGDQVLDLVSVCLTDPTETLSMFTSRVVNGSWRLGVGQRLCSTRARDLVVVDDTVDGEHYTGGGFCNPGLNDRRFADPSGPNCLTNFMTALEPFGLDANDLGGDACLNVFMRVAYDPDGRFTFAAPGTHPGDALVLETCEPQIVAVSNCPRQRG